VEGKCGSLPCEPYNDGHELTCDVCSHLPMRTNNGSRDKANCASIEIYYNNMDVICYRLTCLTIILCRQNKVVDLLFVAMIRVLICDTYLKPLSHQTALPQRLYSVLKPCQRAVGSPRTTRKNIKFVSYTASLQRLWRFHSAQAVAAACLQRAHGAHTAFSRRAHSVLTAIIAFKIFLHIFFILSNPIFQT